MNPSGNRWQAIVDRYSWAWPVLAVAGLIITATYAIKACIP